MAQFSLQHYTIWFKLLHNLCQTLNPVFLMTHSLCDEYHTACRINIKQNVHSPLTIMGDGTTSCLLAATDGGASRSVASFGWTICMDDVDIVSCSGAVPGPSPSSYRAECHGVLLFLLYLYLLLRSSPAPVPYCQLTVYIDCQSLLKKLCLHQD